MQTQETIQQAYFRLQQCDDFSFADPDAVKRPVQVLADAYVDNVTKGNSHNDAISTNGFIHGYHGHEHVINDTDSQVYKDAWSAGKAAA